VEEGFADRQTFFVIFGFKCGWPGLLGAAEPRQMFTVVQKIGRLEVCMFYLTLAVGFRVHTSLKSTCTDFGGGDLVQSVLERSSGRW
jgi:hypothetical protein